MRLRRGVGLVGDPGLLARVASGALRRSGAQQDMGLVQVAGSGATVLRLPAHIFCYLLGQAERMARAGAED